MPIFSLTGGRLVASALLTATLLSACGGGGGASSTAPNPPSQPAATELSLTSSGASAVAGGAAITLSASLNGAGAVSWALANGSPGTLSASSGPVISYIPPATFNGVTAATITATSGSLSKNIVLQLAPTGPGLTLLAGTVTPGNVIIDGRGAAARFSAVRALGSDGSGAVYVADTSVDGKRTLIRKVSADGSVSPLKADWSALPGSDAINAISPMADGSVYFSDVVRIPLSSTTYRGIYTFRKLDASGKLTTLGSVDDGSAATWQLRAAADGTVYVYNGSAIYLLANDGSRQLLAGAGSDQTSADVDGVGAAARFYGIKQVAAAPNGSLYVLDYAGLRQVSTSGAVTTVLAQDARTGATDLSLDAQGNPLLLFAPDTGANYVVRKFSGGALSTVSTLDGAVVGYPTRLLGMPDGAVITTDGVSLQRTGADGKTAVLAGVRDDSRDATADGQGAQARLTDPGLLAADRDGNIYALENVSQFMRPLFRKITPAGVVSNFIGAGLNGYVTGMAITPANTLVVTVRDINDYGGGVYQLGQDGSFTLIAGGGFYAAPLKQQDGQGSAAIFGRPTLSGVDKDGNLYVSDQSQTDSATYTIRKVTPQGAVTTVASLPAGLNAAPDGNVYQINNSGTAVVRVAPDGSRSVVAGVDSGGELTNLPGTLPGLLYKARSVVPLGGKVFALAAGNGVYTLVLP